MVASESYKNLEKNKKKYLRKKKSSSKSMRESVLRDSLDAIYIIRQRSASMVKAR